MEPSFADRLARSRSGDRAEAEGLFARWRPLLRLQARRLLGAELSARVDPSDVVQESLAQAFQSLTRFGGGTEAEWVGWLRAIVAGQAAKAWRHHTADMRDAGRDGPLAEDNAAPAAGPAEAAMSAEHAARLAAAIEGLPAAMREVVTRRVFDGQDFETVARALGRSPGAARVLWTRAVRQLRERLGGPES
jgi:RNA polymerase sigma-70 factor (ECF subfamily)